MFRNLLLAERATRLLKLRLSPGLPGPGPIERKRYGLGAGGYCEEEARRVCAQAGSLYCAGILGVWYFRLLRVIITLKAAQSIPSHDSILFGAQLGTNPGSDGLIGR